MILLIFRQIKYFQVSRSTSDQFTTSVELTISPPDPAIYLAHCVSLQDLYEYYTEPPTDSISLITYVGDDFSSNWDLFDELLSKNANSSNTSSVH